MKDSRMGMRHAIVLLALFGSAAAVTAALAATDFTIQDVSDARKTDVTQIKPDTSGPRSTRPRKSFSRCTRAIPSRPIQNW
jgi:hypothetical protein